MRFSFQKYLEDTGEIGFVDRIIAPSLVYVHGLPGAQPDEVVVFESGEIGQVMAIDESTVELFRFSHNPVKMGSRVVRTKSHLEIPVGDALMGAVIDPLGHSVNPEKPLPAFTDRRPVEVAPSGIQSRARIMRTCETGVTIVDLMIPLGRGQRELIIGDQKAGKSFFLLRTLLSQILDGSVGVYAAIGKSKIAIRQVEEHLERMGIREKVVMVASSSDDPAGLIYLAPYTAMTIAEYFRDKGKDVMLVLDDLTTHAKAYREISLLGRRFPGRSSYPGDIFYAHARLLERAGNFKVAGGDRAITCLPVVEAVQGDITGYIQTNVMSMTDGHIFFDHKLFAEGRRPAIDPFLSVTRVGRQTQSPLKQEIGRTLITFLANAKKLHLFASFGAELSEHIRSTLEKEEHLLQLFDQTAYDRVPPAVQMYLFGTIWADLWRGKPRSEVRAFIQRVIYEYDANTYVRERLETMSRDASSLNVLLERVKNFDIAGRPVVEEVKKEFAVEINSNAAGATNPVPRDTHVDKNDSSHESIKPL